MTIDFYKKTIRLMVNRKQGDSVEYRNTEIYLLHPNEAENFHEILLESDEWEQLARKHPDLIYVSSNIFKNSKFLQWRGNLFDGKPIFFYEISSCCYDVEYEKYYNVRYGELKHYPVDRVIQYIKEQWDKHNVESEL